MWFHEQLSLGYFVGLTIVASLMSAPPARKAAAIVWCAISALIVLVVAHLAPPLPRMWIPNLFLLLGYWATGVLVTSRFFGMVPCDTPFERWLCRSDSWLLPRLPHVPAGLAHIAEFAYLLCYPIVPAAFAVVWWSGAIEQVERFWSVVLAAGYACYVTLPWLVSRPPRLSVNRSGRASPQMANLNLRVLRHFGHELNTFPSGHVAVSWACALVVLAASPIAGAIFISLAMAISVGAAAGGYHYVVDVLLGFVVAAVAAVLLR